MRATAVLAGGQGFQYSGTVSWGPCRAVSAMSHRRVSPLQEARQGLPDRPDRDAAVALQHVRAAFFCEIGAAAVRVHGALPAVRQSVRTARGARVRDRLVGFPSPQVGRAGVSLRSLPESLLLAPQISTRATTRRGITERNARRVEGGVRQGLTQGTSPRSFPPGRRFFVTDGQVVGSI